MDATLLRKFLFCTALYWGLETLVFFAESRGQIILAQRLDEVKPAFTWGVFLFGINNYSPAAGTFLSVAQVLISLAARNRFQGSVPSLVHRYVVLPSTTSISTVLLCTFLRVVNVSYADSGHVALLLLLFHAVNIGHEVAWRMILPAPIVASATNITFIQERHRARPNTELVRIPSTFSPGVYLSGAISRAPEQFGRPPRFLVYLGGNAELWEHSLVPVSKIGSRIGAHTAVFNYRGVGLSGGVTRSAAGMYADAADVVRYLLQTEQGLLVSDVLLFGHSIGGAAAAGVLAHYFPDCSVVLDRTFDSLAHAARALVPILPIEVFDILLRAVFGTMHVSSSWEKIRHERKLITFHRGDSIIPYPAASLARGVLLGPDKRFVVELTGWSLEPHNADLTDCEGSAEALRRMSTFFRP